MTVQSKPSPALGTLSSQLFLSAPVGKRMGLWNVSSLPLMQKKHSTLMLR